MKAEIYDLYLRDWNDNFTKVLFLSSFLGKNLGKFHQNNSVRDFLEKSYVNQYYRKRFGL